MAIPAHVKKLAMDAVAGKETTAEIRRLTQKYGQLGPEIFTPPPDVKAKTNEGPIPDHVKKQAMDAVAKIRPAQPSTTPGKTSAPGGEGMDVWNHPETQHYIRLVKNTGSISPSRTPGQNKDIAKKVAALAKTRPDVNAFHQTITKDNFGRR